MKLKKIITADNSPTLYNPMIDEHYHSTNGAVQESKHIFINAGFKQIEKKSIHILEVGFGTGLNVLLTFNENKIHNKKIYYETIEKFPLDPEIIKELETEIPDNKLYSDIHRSNWGENIHIDKSFVLKKLEIDLEEYEPKKTFDLIYFDAFSPDKQAELWTETIFKKLYKATNPSGILVSYSSKGTVKQALRSAGFQVQRLKGPEGKRHIIRAVK